MYQNRKTIDLLQGKSWICPCSLSWYTRSITFSSLFSALYRTQSINDGQCSHRVCKHRHNRAIQCLNF